MSSQAAGRPRSSAGSRRPLVFLAVLTLVAIISLVRLVTSALDLPRSLGLSQACRMSRMNPAYKREPLGASYSRLGTKYGLYLYREHGVEHSQDPTGTPALFVPGNAGSYGQVRSVASSTARQFYRDTTGLPNAEWANNRGPIDWWTVDFNEDFSAFHGVTMEGQAEYLNDAVRYILDLYHAHLPGRNITSVPILAHSMGGIVARLMPHLPNYIKGSIDTIVTLATPHALPPVPFDKGVEKVYARINEPAWSFTADAARDLTKARAHAQEQADVLLVSIGGGALDTQVASEPTSLSLAVLSPPHAHLSLFAGAMPGLWSSVDHLAMMWCDQLRTRVARAFMQDAARFPTDKQRRGINGLAERRDTWRRALLGGADENDGSDTSSEKAIPMPLEGANSVAANASHATVFFLPPSQASALGAQDPLGFELLTSYPVGENPASGPPISQSIGFFVLLCARATPFSGEGSSSGGASHAEGASCRLVMPWRYELLPPSPLSPAPFPDALRVYAAPGQGIWRLHLNAQALREERVEWIRVERRGAQDDGWVRTTWTGAPKMLEVRGAGFDVQLDQLYPAGQHDLLTQLVIPSMDSSLLAYDLEIEPTSCPTPTGDVPAFAPLLRAQHRTTHDARLYPSLPLSSSSSSKSWQAPLALYASSPYMPRAPAHSRGTLLQFWADPAAGRCGAPFARVRAKVNWYKSAGLLGVRYRIATFALPFAILALALRRQWAVWDAAATFPNLLGTLAALTTREVPALLLLSSALPFFQALALSALSSTPTSWLARALRDASLGNEDASFWFLAPLFVVIAYGETVIVATLLDALVWTIGRSIKLFGAGRHAIWAPIPDRLTFKPASWVSLGLLLILVLTFVPYQFSFLVAFLVHLFSTVRSVLSTSSTSTRAHDSPTQTFAEARVAQHAALLNLLFWLLPLKATVLPVWIRNLSLGWNRPFGPDHNVLEVLSILLVVQVAATGRTVGRAMTSNEASVTGALSLLLMLYALIWGVRHTYRLYDLSNLLFIWLIIVHWRTRRAASQSTGSNGAPATWQPVPTEDEDADTREGGESAELKLLSRRDVLGHDSSTSLRRAVPCALADSSSQERLDDALERYLEALDAYLSARERAGHALAAGFFDLARAKMDLGHVRLGATTFDARLKATLQVRVQIGSDNPEKPPSFKLVKVEPSADDEEEVTQKDASPSTSRSGEQAEGQGLRRRKAGEGDADRNSSGQETSVSPQHDHDEKKPNTQGPSVSYSSSSQSKRKTRPPDALYQFAALPPPSLRRAHTKFGEVLDALIGASSPSRGGGSGERAQEDVMVIAARLGQLEEEVRLLRREVEVDDGEEGAHEEGKEGKAI